MARRFLALFTCCIGAFIQQGHSAITISNIVDKTKYDAPRTFTVTADPNAETTTATLDGLAITVGVSFNVTSFGYHELIAQSRSGTGALVDSQRVRFITRDPRRGDTEDGIPPHTPFPLVNDAPSAFAGQTLAVIAPAAWPGGLPIPIAATLRSAAGEPVRLNGLVRFAGLPQTTLQLRRGWGAVVAPARSTSGAFDLAANVDGVVANRSITMESAPTFTDVSGAISSNTTWPPNSRIHVTDTLTVNSGATLTIGAGTIVLVNTGTGTTGSAAEIIVRGTLQVNGTEAEPVVFAPAAAGENWGGIELPESGSVVNAANAIFTGAGEDQDWFGSHAGYSSHRPEQTLFLLAGSGTGTAIGAQLHLTNCYCFDVAGQMMNSRTNTWIDLQRTLMQRAITCGELNGSKVTIDRCALIEFPRDDSAFVDGDNDAIYLTNGDLSLTNNVIGFSKDDGVDSGANGGDNPFTAMADITPFRSENNWYEATFHEGNSLSGTRNVTFTRCVFFNCGQGIEDGYSASSAGDGPNALADGCLFSSNMVGVRWGDNYGSGYNYNGSFEVKNSLLLHSLYHDAFSGNWHPTLANAWIYQDATANNSFGRAYFNLHDNTISQPDQLHHPANTVWDPANVVQTALLESFMPVPGSNVGVAINLNGPVQNEIASFPGFFTARLSTFSSKPVTVNWALIGKVDPAADEEFRLLTGTLAFAPGETVRTINAAIPSIANFAVLRVALTNPVNAEVTGEAWYFKSPLPDANVIPRASSGWRYRETRSEPPATWKQLNFDDTSATATEWLPCTLPAGFGVSGVNFGTTATRGPDNDVTRAFYFRKKFQVAHPEKVTALTLRLRRDDAAVVWVNNDATPTVVSADGAFNPPYSYAMSGVPNSTNTGNELVYTIPATKLAGGANIVAIEVHQSSLNSNDLLLDCELVATYEAPFELKLTRVGGQPVLFWFDSTAILEESNDLNSWRPVPGAITPETIDLSNSQRFFRLRR